MDTFVLTSKDQLLIPKRLRNKYGIQTGIRIALIESRDGVLLKPMDEAFFNKYIGKFKDSAPTLREYKAWKKEDKEKEDRNIKAKQKR